ncbi:contractile injection system tape measure protein [Nitrosomonas marina]|uniref:Uncharacterized protein n=1 Tax=Nitrosomonas marina TaxID=917 RepID=A0A1H8C5H5_9PROT|nr:contractile injection system tape measure protein [Nitrosomonas marina]SEM90333.1 hypothetical protein SAMN05216325_10419 [Nitrosomonas marina]
MATIGYDSASVHVIEQVIFDFSFAADTVEPEHESQLSDWIVRTLLPAMEVVLNEHDEADKVLRINQVTLDLGAISEANFPDQIVQILQEQFGLQLKQARESSYHHLVTLPLLHIPTTSVSGKTDNVIPVSLIQSGFEELKQFMLTGSLPWYIDTNDVHWHEKLMERVLKEAVSTSALREMLMQMPQQDRTLFVWRMVQQFSPAVLRSVLYQMDPQHHRLQLGLIESIQTMLSKSALPAERYNKVMTALWAWIIDDVTSQSPLPGSTRFSRLIRQYLKMIVVPMLHEEAGLLLDRLIETARVHDDSEQLSVILSQAADHGFQEDCPSAIQRATIEHLTESEQIKATHTGNGQDEIYGSGNEKDTSVAGSLSLSRWLYRRIFTAMQHAGISAPFSDSANEQPLDISGLQQRLRTILQDTRARDQIIARLPQTVLMDILFAQSPQIAFIVGQFVLKAERFYRYAQNQRHSISVSFDDWINCFWKSVLRFVTTVSLAGTSTDTLAAAGIARALTQCLYDEPDNTTILQTWYQALELTHSSEDRYSLRILQIIVADAMAYSAFEKHFLPDGQAVHHLHGKQQSRQAQISTSAYNHVSTSADLGSVDSNWAGDASDPVTSGIVSALKSAAIVEKEPSVAQFRFADVLANREWLLTLLSDQLARARIVAELPEPALIDMVYRISPYAAQILAQTLTYANTLYQSTVNPRDADISAWRQRLFDNVLDFIQRTQNFDFPDSDFDAVDFCLAMTQGMSQDSNGAAILTFWQYGLRRQREQQGECIVEMDPDNSLIDILFAASTERPAIKVIAEIRQIAVLLKDDYTQQLRRLRTLFEYGRLHTGTVPEVDLKSMIHGILNLYPGSDRADRIALAEAIDSHARHIDNSAGYYFQVLKKLVYDEDIDLEALVSSAAEKEPEIQPEIPKLFTENELFIQKPCEEILLSRLLITLRQAGINRLDLNRFEANQIAFARQQLVDLLLEQDERQKLIARLPESTLLDISYVLSPQAAFILAQLIRHADTLLLYDENVQYRPDAAWLNQLWNHALRYLADTSLHRNFKTNLFFRALALGQSEGQDAVTILCSWSETLNKLQDERYAYATNVFYNFVQDAIFSLRSPEQCNFPTDEQIDLIQQLQTTDPHTLKRDLRLALEDGRLVIAALTETRARALVQELLECSSELKDEDRRLFIKAIESHLPESGNSAVYFQLILQKLLFDDTVDLEAVVTQSETTNSVISVETVATTAKEHVIEPINKRIRSALQQAGIAGTEQYAGQFIGLSKSDATLALREQLLALVHNAVSRQKLIEKLPESILIDVAYTVSPQSVFILADWLSHAEFFRQYTKNIKQPGPDVWRQQIWDSGLKALSEISHAGKSDETVEETTVTFEFVYALLQDLAGDGDALGLARIWNQALLIEQQGYEQKDTVRKIQHTSVLQHLLQGVLIQYGSVSGNQVKKPENSPLLSPNLAQDVQFKRPAVFDSNSGKLKDECGDEYFIQNAGLVLAAPYLPHLFGRLGWLDNDGLINAPAIERAVHLLQFIVNEASQFPEYQLILNKILCGLPVVMPVSRNIQLNTQERETAESLLNGIIQNWKVLGKTSMSGLRETFLQRRGRLLLQEDMWSLTIEPGPFDMLLDQLPWSFSVIKYKWMTRAIQVAWR